MAIGTALEQASFEELKHIMRWLADANANRERIPGVIVGGWAVYAYNPYYGSIDIDLVVSGNMRKSLSNWLIKNRGFRPWKTEEAGWTGVRKLAPAAASDEKYIIADFGSRQEVYRFEGRAEELNFSELDGHVVSKTIDDLAVLVPERALLVLFKLKAAWDRGTRIAANASTRPDWDAAKRVKDLADVLALVDPGRGGDDISIGYLGAKLEKHPFLVAVLDEAGTSGPAISRYGRLQPAEARKAVRNLVELAT